MVLKFGHCGKFIRNIWKDLNCGDVEGWIRSAVPNVVRNEEVLHTVREERDILNTIN